MTVTIRHGDCREVLRTLPDQSVHCCVTSPPYFGLRDYGVAGQIGLEPTPDEFVAELVDAFNEVRRVLRDDGTLWLNLGDSYATQGGKNTTPHMGGIFADRTRGQTVISRSKRMERGAGRWGGGNNGPAGLKPKDMIGIPWRAAFALQEAGWYLRQDIIWSKPNPMPESVQDRCTKAHEYIFLLSKSERYHFDQASIAERSIYADSGRSSAAKDELDPIRKRNGSDGNAASFRAITQTRNKRSVWEVSTKPFAEAHFATFPPDLIEPCILAGCPAGGIVLDPFGGAGTTGLVADRLGRDAILIELNPEYAAMAERRIQGDAGMFASTSSVSSPYRQGD